MCNYIEVKIKLILKFYIEKSKKIFLNKRIA